MVRPKPWILAALAVLTATVSLKYYGETDERKTRRAPRPSPRAPVDPSIERQDTAERSISGPPTAPSTTLLSYRLRPELEPEPRLEPGLPGSLTLPSLEPQPPPAPPQTAQPGGLPPCPQPSAELRSALTRGDWDAVHHVIGGVLDRTDCDPGRWRELQWAQQESFELARARRGMQAKHPAEPLRGLHLAVLAMLDSPAPLKPSAITVEEVSAPDQAGYRRITGADEAGARMVLLTPQTAQPADELTVLAMPQPEAGEPGLQRDMIRYAPLVNGSAARELLDERATRARLPEDFRREIEGGRELDEDSGSQELHKTRARVRKMAEQGLAAIDALPAQSPAGNGEVAARAAHITERERQLYTMLEGFLAYERGWPVNPAMRSQPRGPEPP